MGHWSDPSMVYQLMNIFVLDRDPEIAAQFLMDKHVVKMALETAQILSTINGGPYLPTHTDHPCVRWASEAIDNYRWLVKHGLAICSEYTYRYGKIHKCQEVIWLLEDPYEIELPAGSTPFVKCMPPTYKQFDVVESYRRYYESKASFAAWTIREKPYWWLT